MRAGCEASLGEGVNTRNRRHGHSSLIGRERDDSIEESKEEPCARTTPQEKPLPPVLAQRSLLLHRRLRPPATESASQADGENTTKGRPKHNYTTKYEATKGRTDVHHWDEIGRYDRSAEYLPTLKAARRSAASTRGLGSIEPC